MAKYFGTDGIRGRFGDSLICPQFAYRIGCALGNYLAKLAPKKRLLSSLDEIPVRVGSP